ncbi:hypothetical protein LCGC14_0391280 [marine sediment metagenome]|uniref:Uncharacterized protein n=1 Tax=marine sediment metagenome TaxID=412755 RepID=A0A0F9THG1_9ZZZZ
MTGRFWLAVSWVRALLIEGVNDFVRMLVVAALLFLLGFVIAGAVMRTGWLP